MSIMYDLVHYENLSPSTHTIYILFCISYTVSFYILLCYQCFNGSLVCLDFFWCLVLASQQDVIDLEQPSRLVSQQDVTAKADFSILIGLIYIVMSKWLVKTHLSVTLLLLYYNIMNIYKNF